MLHMIHINQNDLSYQNLRNKSTVKKQKNFANNLNRFNLTSGKENQSNHMNLNANLQYQKTIDRKQNETQIQEKFDRLCTNHQDKYAQFNVKIQGEILNYCRKCATQIASQGFQVQKISIINQQSTNNRRSTLTINKNTSPNIFRPKNLSKTTRRPQLTQFIKHMKNLRSEYFNKQNHLTEISESYEMQKQNISNYYASLIQYIEDMRDTHLQAIQKQSINNTQICQIEVGEVVETINQIDSIVLDIQSNFQKIVNEVDDDTYIECFAFYRQKQGLFNHRLEEIGAEAKPWNCTDQAQLENKFQSFKRFLNELHGLNEGEQSQQQEQKYSY